MWYKIKQGRRRAYPLSLGIHTGKTSESYEVIFDDSCRYTLDSENQEDWNKLVGWSYGLLPDINFELGKDSIDLIDTKFEVISAHHQNSIRLAWKYDPKVDKILVCRYIYENRIRREEDITEYEIGVKHTMRLSSRLIPKWGYNLDIYFGGRNDRTGKDNVAPHDMNIWLRKI